MRRLRITPVDRTIFGLALPALASLAADPLYSLADTAFVGHLGRNELGAVAVGSAAFTASFWLFSFLAFGVTPRVARAIGAEDKKLAAAIGVQALVLAGALGVTVSLLGLLFAEPVVRLLGGRGEVLTLATPYLRIRAFSSAPLLISLVGHGWLRGNHDTRTPMFVATSGALMHVGLDYLFIYPLGWGVQGAAWATVVGQGGVALVFLAVLSRKMTEPRWRLDAQVMRSLLQIGADLIVRSGALVGALTFATAVAARMGVVSLGAWQVTMQMYAFLAFAQDSIAIAAQPMIGRLLGAGEFHEAKATAKRLLTWGVAFGVVLGLVVFILRRPLAGVFSDDRAVVATAAGLLGWLAVIQPLSATAFTLDGILIGASDTRLLAISMVGSSALFAATSLLALELDWKTAGLAAGVTIWLTARSTSLGLRLMRGRWTGSRKTDSQVLPEGERFD